MSSAAVEETKIVTSHYRVEVNSFEEDDTSDLESVEAVSKGESR